MFLGTVRYSTGMPAMLPASDRIIPSMLLVPRVPVPIFILGITGRSFLFTQKCLKSKRATAVLRIRYVFPGSRIRIFSIPDPNLFHPGSASKNLRILTQKNYF